MNLDAVLVLLVFTSSSLYEGGISMLIILGGLDFRSSCEGAATYRVRLAAEATLRAI